MKVFDYINEKLKSYRTVKTSSQHHSILGTKLQKVENRFHDANQFLKNTSVTRNDIKINLNDLPWFLIIGHTHSGKSTLLSHSGINYILDKKIKAETHRVIPHSEHCDWWVTPHSVLIEVPGDYIGYKSKMVSLANKLWRHFITLIKQTRGEHALSGVVITLSLPELLDKQRREWLIESLQCRIQELTTHFGADLPFYFAITKCDLLPGFLDFFSDYADTELAQAWGISLQKLEEYESLPEIFAMRFNDIIKRLNQQLIWRLHQERSAQSKLYIKDFPLQLEQLKEALTAVLKGIDNKGVIFQLQGVYLTSATQQPYEDFATNRQILSPGELQNALSILQMPGAPTQAYFIKQFLLQALIPQKRKIKWAFAWPQINISSLFTIGIITIAMLYATQLLRNNNQEMKNTLALQQKQSIVGSQNASWQPVKTTQVALAHISTNERG